MQNDSAAVHAPDLIACPTCDAIYTSNGTERLACTRCHRVLVQPEKRAGLQLLGLSLLALGLIYGAVTTPFLTVKRFWMTTDATLIQTALAFEGVVGVLALICLCVILVLPALRAGLTTYVVAPLVLAKPALPFSRQAFAWVERLRPWSMAEIFLVGAGVALFKITALAEVSFGPAFYMFAVLVVVLWAQDASMCRHSVWKALEK